MKIKINCYFLIICAVILLVSVVSAQTTATITVTGVVKPHDGCDDGGSSSDDWPHAAFIGTPTSGHGPLLVKFTDKSTGYPGTWKWEYRTGITGHWTEFSTLKNPNHTFPLGIYDIRLKVTNTHGFDSTVKFGYIRSSAFVEKPVAKFSADPSLGRAPLKVTFTDSSLNNPDTYAWKFGDGDSSDLKNPTHIYDSPGIYRVKLTVSNSAGKDHMESFVVAMPKMWRWHWMGWDRD